MQQVPPTSSRRDPRKAIPGSHPQPRAPVGSSWRCGRQRAPATFPRAALPAPPPPLLLLPSPPTPWSPDAQTLHPSVEASIHPHTPWLSAASGGCPQVSNFLPRGLAGTKPPNRLLFLSRRSSFTRPFLFPALHPPQKPTRVRTTLPSHSHASYPYPSHTLTPRD